MLAKLMSTINNQSIDADLFDRICDAMLERLKDEDGNYNVQVQAIGAVCRLQQPKDCNCRVIEGKKI